VLNDDIHIIYENNGIGVKPCVEKEGIGLKSIRSRLEKLNGKLVIDSVLNRGIILDIEIRGVK
jgi:signal transduction histidine kinase